jgi:S-adenosylmethionine-diacylglycerol 3-amino-3-carboxypropyl transferase
MKTKNTESPFFTRLSYSFGNEDHSSELQALEVQRNHRVVCISASGDRPLHLLLNTCKEVVAIDANHTQNCLLQLKCAAMHGLNYDQYLAFLGLIPCADRKKLFYQLLPSLGSGAADCWTKNLSMISKGIIYQGATEQWVRKVSFLIRLMRSREVNALFSAKDLKEQKFFLQNDWNHGLWKRAFNLFLHPWITSRFLKDPGIYSNVDPSIQPGCYIYDRLMNCLNYSLAKENPLISIIFQGKVFQEGYPPYLTPEGVTKIKSNLDKLTIETMDVIDFLESSPPNSFHSFSLSDVVSYMTYEDYCRLLRAIQRTAVPGARFCIRQFMSRYQIPLEAASCFKRDRILEKKLEEEDKAFVYHFTVGSVQSNL